MPTEVEPAANMTDAKTSPPFTPEHVSFTPPNSAHTYGPPLKPRAKLAIGLFIGFLAWMGVLWAMYFSTVYHKVGPSTAVEVETLVPRGGAR